ncbi:ParB/RepB/Spo0J family partition protein [Nannocystis bainbridge]|uniref:ParB/Spo0J HTH domain-containing protein n=1 Tax=Nannocystis bainbridge TaxID=2995303 RepID=A0ABT5E1W9_9BACT|nr:hypothetical protein [Nannocystis bainbridge]MDC0719428.1 hypothetical protein [Nannocystis bainbridge]
MASKSTKKAPTNRAAATAAKPAQAGKPKSAKPTKAAAKVAEEEAASAIAPSWCYAAAVACDLVLRDLEWQATRRAKSLPRWEDGGVVPCFLAVLVREGPGVLERVHELLPSCPRDWRGWAAERDALFEKAGVVLDFRKLADRQVVQVSPHHIELATDPKHSMFDRRALLPPDRGLAESIKAVGEVVEVLQLTPHEDEDGTTRLYSGSGSRRTQATRLANRLLLEEWMQQVRRTNDGKRATLAPPVLIRTVHAMVRREGKARTVAAVVANQMRLEEDLIREADGVEQLLAAGYRLEDVAARTGKSLRTVTNLHSLNKLAAELRDEVTQGKLPAVVAYRLAMEPSKKRQVEAARATDSYKTGGPRCQAIDCYLAGQPLPVVAPKKPTMASRTIHAAAERLAAASLPAELGPFVLMAKAMAGDHDAMAALPPQIRGAFVDPAKQAKQRLRWQEAGFDETSQMAWMAASDEIGPEQAKRLQGVGALPEHLNLSPTVHLLDEVEEESWGLASDTVTLGSLLDDFIINEAQVAADAGRDGQRVTTYAEHEELRWSRRGFTSEETASWRQATQTPSLESGCSSEMAAALRDSGVTPAMLLLAPTGDLLGKYVASWDFETNERLSLGLFVMEAGLEVAEVLKDAASSDQRFATGGEALALLEAEDAAE